VSAQRKRKRTSPKPRPLPLVSSNRVLTALRRLGFIDGPAKGSSHLSMHRLRADGKIDVVSVVLDQNPMPRGTLHGILKTGNVSHLDFLKALGVKR